jgi:hypothetical protein
VDGTRSFFIGVNGGAATEIPVSGTSWGTPASRAITVTLAEGDNTIRFFNDSANAPDLDKITIS